MLLTLIFKMPPWSLLNHPNAGTVDLSPRNNKRVCRTAATVVTTQPEEGREPRLHSRCWRYSEVPAGTFLPAWVLSRGPLVAAGGSAARVSHPHPSHCWRPGGGQVVTAAKLALP